MNEKRVFAVFDRCANEGRGADVATFESFEVAHSHALSLEPTPSPNPGGAWRYIVIPRRTALQ